jgi:hypothetical protein
MTRSNLVLGGVAVLALVLAGALFLHNQALEDDLASARRATAAAEESARVAANGWTEEADGFSANGPRSAAIRPPSLTTGTGPALDKPRRETVMQRRARMSELIQAMFGRGPDETEDEYRARIAPMIEMYLDKPRGYATKRREQAEARAGVTKEQSAQIDAEVAKIYDDVISYTNQAVTDGQVSPYSRNVAGLLQYAGGLGSILTDAEGRFGKILTPQQLKTMYEMGFEWGEYLGLNAPWEKLNPPPPPPGGGS